MEVKKGDYEGFRMRSDLKRIMDVKGVGIRPLARELDIRYETVRKLYHDEVTRFPTDVLAKICVYLDVPINELLLIERSDD